MHSCKPVGAEKPRGGLRKRAERHGDLRAGRKLITPRMPATEYQNTEHSWAYGLPGAPAAGKDLDRVAGAALEKHCSLGE